MDILQYLQYDCDAIKKRIDSIFDKYTYLMKVSNDKKTHIGTDTLYLSISRLPSAILLLIVNTFKYNKNSGV